MDWTIIIGTIASCIAAYYGVRNDKGHIKKCIRKKEQKIKELENQKFRKYHNKTMFGVVTPEDDKIEKLRQEISDLEDRL